MTVNSLSFMVFIAALALVYYTVGRNIQWICLLVGSLFFALMAGNRLLGYLLLNSLSTWVAVRLMGWLDEELNRKSDGMTPADKKKEKSAVKEKKKWIVAALAVLNVGILVVTKYSDFLVMNLNRFLEIFGISGPEAPGFLVPLGISYYTLQSLGYALDVYKGKVKPEKNFFKALLFICFFPQMTQGPIGRFKELAPQLFGSRCFSYENLSMGCQRILWGLFKKAVIADRLKPVIDRIFNHYDQYSGMTIFMGCIYMSLQMYADFSGYMDIVAGTSEIFGIQIAENFQRPFFSQSLAEYWRRWHITLSGWFRDYVFYPLSISKPAVKFGKIGKKIFGIRIGRLFPAIFAMVIVWMCTGLWHDASWRYILWGAANGGIMILSMCLEPVFQKMKDALHIPAKSRGWEIFSMMRTFLLVSLLKVFPGAGSTRQSLSLLKRIFTDFSPSFTYKAFFPGLKTSHLLFVGIGLTVLLIVSICQERAPVRKRLAKKPAVARWCCYLALVAGILCMGAFQISMVGGFAYAQY